MVIVSYDDAKQRTKETLSIIVPFMQSHDVKLGYNFQMMLGVMPDADSPASRELQKVAEGLMRTFLKSSYPTYDIDDQAEVSCIQELSGDALDEVLREESLVKNDME